MLKRIFIGVLGVIAVVLVVGLAVAWVQRDQLVFWWSSPRINYGEQRTIIPVYLFAEQWAAHPDKRDNADLVPPGMTDNQATAQVDVFFIHGSSYFGYQWNAEVRDAAVNTVVDGPLMALDASVFNGCCRVFAPRYRQAHFAAIDQTSGNGRNALELAFNDITRAWDSYVMDSNKGRPVIIVGHDQGAVLAQRLLDLRIEPGTRLSERMVAAYLIGGGIAERRFGGSFKNIKICETATDAHCVVAWETFVEGTDPVAHPNAKEAWDNRAWTFLDEERRLCTNPLTWTVNSKADASLHLGALPLGADISLGFGRIMGALPTSDPSRYKSLPALIPKYTSAECIDGFLYVPEPKDAAFKTGWRGEGNLHLSDITLFYGNLRQNLIDRSEAFLKTFVPDSLRAMPGAGGR